MLPSVFYVWGSNLYVTFPSVHKCKCCWCQLGAIAGIGAFAWHSVRISSMDFLSLLEWITQAWGGLICTKLIARILVNDDTWCLVTHYKV